MHAWEYKTVTAKTKGGILRTTDVTEDFVDSCNHVGRDGWELVAALPLAEANGRTVAVELIFKRPR